MIALIFLLLLAIAEGAWVSYRLGRVTTGWHLAVDALFQVLTVLLILGAVAGGGR